jgi:membrane associated rhomboid family serine protease
MIPYSDGVASRRFPVVNVALIAANFAVFLFYELPNGDAAVYQASFIRVMSITPATWAYLPKLPLWWWGAVRAADCVDASGFRLIPGSGAGTCAPTSQWS